jgi:hypothetical protein
MNQQAILMLVRLPARLDTQQAAALLGFQEHDLPVLVRAKLLKPLGNPPPNGCKFFSSSELELLAKDSDWLSRASRAVTQYWRQKNEQRMKQAHTSSIA